MARADGLARRAETRCLARDIRQGLCRHAARFGPSRSPAARVDNFAGRAGTARIPGSAALLRGGPALVFVKGGRGASRAMGICAFRDRATLRRAEGDHRCDLGPRIAFRSRRAEATGAPGPGNTGLHGTSACSLLSGTSRRSRHPRGRSCAGRDAPLVLGRRDGAAAIAAFEILAVCRRRRRRRQARHLALRSRQPCIDCELSARAWLGARARLGFRDTRPWRRVVHLRGSAARQADARMGAPRPHACRRHGSAKHERERADISADAGRPARTGLSGFREFLRPQGVQRVSISTPSSSATSPTACATAQRFQAPGRRSTG